MNGIRPDLLPISILMKEHRLIERGIKLLTAEMNKIQETKQIDPLKIDLFVDFLRTYTDRNHHGKEEDILFKQLNDKGMFEEHQTIMDKLIKEHEEARRLVSVLVDAKQKFVTGDLSAVDEVIRCIQSLIDFYPKHIYTEDHEFFVPSMDYFEEEELTKMMADFEEFDKSMLHEKYEAIIEGLEME